MRRNQGFVRALRPGQALRRRVIEKFSIEYLQILDENGNCDDELRPLLNDKEIQRLYEWMILARTLDERRYRPFPPRGGDR